MLWKLNACLSLFKDTASSACLDLIRDGKIVREEVIKVRARVKE